MNGISPIGGPAPITGLGASVGAATKGVAPGFSEALTQALARADGRVTAADQSVSDFLTGKAQSTHEVMIRLEEAQLALQYTVQLRNRALEAYNEVMRMPL